MSSALVLFSGGLDSTTCLYTALKENQKVIAVSFDYSQKHKVELEKANILCSELNVEHIIVKIQTDIFLNSSLVSKDILVPKDMNYSEDIPNTYVPGRNLLFLSFAVSIAESREIHKIYIGVNALDYSGYPDCRPEFINSFQKTIELGTKAGHNKKTIQIETPLIHKNKKEIVETAYKLGVPFSKTFSCYDPVNGKPCGHCDSCILRKKGFAEAGILDN